MDAIVLEDSKGRKMSDEEFERFCQANPDMRIERNSNLEISIMSPNLPISGKHGAYIVSQLFLWNSAKQSGVVFDSSAGFTLPDNSILCPDASWMSNSKWNSLSKEELQRFSHVCPEFVVEIRSKSDNQKELKSKMETWIANGAELAWLIDPIKKIYWIYRPGQSPEELLGSDVILKGEGPVEGFELNLNYLN